MTNTPARVPESGDPAGGDVIAQERKSRRIRMPPWLIYSLLTVLLYGIWGALSKVVSNDMSPYMYQVAFSVGLLPVVAVVLRSRRLSGGHDRKRGILYAFGTGVLGGTGNMALFKSLGMGGPAAIAVPVSSMYSVVTVVLAFLFLKERVSRSQKIGLLLAFAAIYLLST
jgi:transporter family protein